MKTVKQNNNFNIQVAMGAVILVLLFLVTYQFGKSQPEKKTSSSTTPTETQETVLKIDGDKMLGLINDYRAKNGLNPLIKSDNLCKVTEEMVSEITKDRFLSYRENRVNAVISEISDKYIPIKPITAIYDLSVGKGLGGEYVSGFDKKPWDWWRPQYLWDVPTLFNSIMGKHTKTLLAKTAKEICIDSFINKDGDMYIILFSNFREVIIK